MTDDPTMDKKGFGIPPSKSASQEVFNRPRQDGSGGSPLARSYPKPPNRRRESPAGNSNGPNSRSEALGRKPTPQKSKTFDKRPRHRVFSNAESVVDKNEEPEMGSIQAPGSKKQNLNHLLNFHFAPRESRAFSAASWRSHNTHPGGSWRSRHGSGGAISRPKFNKEQFLQANCQFMVKSTGDYSVYKADPDLLVEWNLVEQIFIRTIGETPSCPICLTTPVAAKMTRCGHIFCWPCLLHYLALSDKQCRKCPICYELVHKEDLKSVVSNLCADVRTGNQISMQLMCRPKDSFTVMPLMCRSGIPYDWEILFSKLLIVTPSEVKECVIEREQLELTLRHEEDKDCPEACFVEQAMQELQLRRSEITHMMNEVTNQKANLVAGSLNLSNLDFGAWEPSSGNSNAATYESKQSRVVSVSKPRNDSVGSDSAAGSGSDDDSSAAKELDRDVPHIFYQASDGQNVFLHPLNMAMLRKAFGADPFKWPQVIHFRVVEKEPNTMTQEVKKRLKFLRHLPITTTFHLVEIELKPPVVSEEVLVEFGSQLTIRKNRRAERIKAERRRDRIHEEESRKLNYFPPCPKIESKFDFPDCGTKDDFGVCDTIFLASILESHEPMSNINRNTDSMQSDQLQSEACGITIPESQNRLIADSDKHGLGLSSSPSMSFAQIVSQRSAVKRSPTFPITGAWGKPPPVLQASVPRRHSDSEPDPDDYTPVPEYRLSVSDAIAKAIANVHVSEGNEGNSNTGGQKKKKKKGKVLFATGMGSYN